MRAGRFLACFSPAPSFRSGPVRSSLILSPLLGFPGSKQGCVAQGHRALWLLGPFPSALGGAG